MEFTQFITWLSENGFSLVASFLGVIFGLVVMIIQIKKYKINSNQSKELTDMKYRLENYQSKKDFVPTGQKFRRVVPVYELDEKTNTLVVVGKQDIQELVQSSRDCGLDIILEKYGVLPDMLIKDGRIGYEAAVKGTGYQYDLSDVREDLEVLSDFFNEMADIRQRYGVSPDVSPEALSNILKEKKAKLDKDLSEHLNLGKSNQEVSHENKAEEN